MATRLDSLGDDDVNARRRRSLGVRYGPDLMKDLDARGVSTHYVRRRITPEQREDVRGPAPLDRRPPGPRSESAEADSHPTAYLSWPEPGGSPRGRVAVRRIALAGNQGRPRCSPPRPPPGQSNPAPSARPRSRSRYPRS